MCQVWYRIIAPGSGSLAYEVELEQIQLTLLNVIYLLTGWLVNYGH